MTTVDGGTSKNVRREAIETHTLPQYLYQFQHILFFFNTRGCDMIIGWNIYHVKMLSWHKKKSNLVCKVPNLMRYNVDSVYNPYFECLKIYVY